MFQCFILDVLIRAIVNVPMFYPRCPNPCNCNLSDFTWFFSAGPVDSIREIRFKHVFILGLQLGFAAWFAACFCSTRHRQVNWIGFEYFVFRLLIPNWVTTGTYSKPIAESLHQSKWKVCFFRLVFMNSWSCCIVLSVCIRVLVFLQESYFLGTIRGWQGKFLSIYVQFPIRL